MLLPKMAAHWLFSFYRAARKVRSYGYLFLHRRSSHQPATSLYASDAAKCSLEGRERQTLLCDFDGSLLRSPSMFPFFMLVAFEGGGLLRALVLLLSSPVVWALGSNTDLSVRVMTFISFCGLRVKDAELVARAVLPKFYLEDLHREAYEVLASTGRRVVVTGMPRVMVEGFSKEYLGASKVVGAELHVVKGSYFTGLVAASGSDARQRTVGDLFGKVKADVGLVGSSSPHDHFFISPHCKETYVVNKDESSSASCASASMPRDRYPKPLVFHDGRLGFLPTPSATLSLFLWLPLGVPLSILRIAAGVLLPYKAACLVGAAMGLRLRVGGLPLKDSAAPGGAKGVLYVCTHRTLLDPVMLSLALRKSVPAVTYSLSRMSEFLAPMRTVRLTRDRARDAETMRRLLAEGDLAVCPEGTTCREPYLLRFSSLFAEMAEELVPVAMEARAGMLYGTTASGLKCLDSAMFLANPDPVYRVELLGRVPKELTCSGGWTGSEVANRVQRQLADALGFECTGLTRKDKYRILAGNEGVVQPAAR